MFSVCVNCGEYREDKIIRDGSFALCPNCNHPHPFKMLPLFVLTGASATGKSTLCYELAQRQANYVALEVDVFWRDEFISPEDDYYEFRNLCLRVANNIQQAGKAVILCGSATPSQYEKCVQSRYFSQIHYLAMVCNSDKLEARLKARPEWRDSSKTEFIQNMLAYNQWFKDNAKDSPYDLTLLDTTSISIDDSVKQVIHWFTSKIQNYET
jgi:broad-specificity NMP kinase